MDWRSKSYSELFRESHYYYLLKCYHSVKEEIAEDTMSELHVRAWLNHIPNPENRHLPKDERWDDDVYDLVRFGRAIPERFILPFPAKRVYRREHQHGRFHCQSFLKYSEIKKTPKPSIGRS